MAKYVQLWHGNLRATARLPARQGHQAFVAESQLQHQIPCGKNAGEFLGKSIEIVGKTIEIVGKSIEIVGKTIEIVGKSIEIVGKSIEIVGKSIEIVDFNL